MQSACKATAAGDAISTAQFSAEGWLKTSVPSTVLAAQVKAGVFPDPYFGDNLRKIPGTSYPVGHNFSNLPMPADSPYALRLVVPQGIHGAGPLREGQSPLAALRRHQLPRRGLGQRPQDRRLSIRLPELIAPTISTSPTFVVPGKANVLAVKTSAPTEKDLGINWVDWNPCPPDKDMGLWGAVDLRRNRPRHRALASGCHSLSRWLIDQRRSDRLRGTAQRHRAPVKGMLTGTAAGVNFEKPVELAAHEDQTVVFSPEQFPALRLQNPKPWWPRQMGEPHLEHSQSASPPKGTPPTNKASTSASAKSLPN